MRYYSQIGDESGYARVDRRGISAIIPAALAE